MEKLYFLMLVRGWCRVKERVLVSRQVRVEVRVRVRVKEIVVAMLVALIDAIFSSLVASGVFPIAVFSHGLYATPDISVVIIQHYVSNGFEKICPMYVCTHACMRLRIHVCMRLRTHVWMYICTYHVCK